MDIEVSSLQPSQPFHSLVADEETLPPYQHLVQHHCALRYLNACCATLGLPND